MVFIVICFTFFSSKLIFNDKMSLWGLFRLQLQQQQQFQCRFCDRFTFKFILSAIFLGIFVFRIGALANSSGNLANNSKHKMKIIMKKGNCEGEVPILCFTFNPRLNLTKAPGGRVCHTHMWKYLKTRKFRTNTACFFF